MIYRIFKKSYFDNSFKKSGKIESGQKKSGKIESGQKKSGKIESEQKKSGKIERVSEQSAVVGKYLKNFQIEIAIKVGVIQKAMFMNGVSAETLVILLKNAGRI